MSSTVSRIACIGTGMIGRAWAQTFASAGYRVALYDVDPASSGAALETLRSEEPQLQDLFERETNLEAALQDAMFVQESAPESTTIKRQLFEAMDRIADDTMMFGSSTSTLPGSSFLCGLGISTRSLVVHPTNPPHLVPLVELCRTRETSDEAYCAVVNLLHECGQTPIDIRRETFGFVLNRLQAAVVAEALRLVAEGTITATDLDKVVTDGLGLRWAASGPFETGHLNAPGGYADYMTKFSEAWNALFQAIGTTVDLNPELIRRIDGELRQSQPIDPALRRARRDDLIRTIRGAQEAAYWSGTSIR